MASELITVLRAGFAAQADAQRALAMQAYMKSGMPYYGIATPVRRRLVAQAVSACPARSTPELESTMRQLWQEAHCREERYAALELARVGPHKKFFSLSLLPLYEQMIREGAWWDYCDDISGNAIGALLQRHLAEMKPVLRAWAAGDNLWLRRAAMICQRGLKQGFDAVLLYDTLLPSMGASPMAKEFFIRKGMGWALRERSYAAPLEVQAFCREYAEQLSPLTVREALKVIRRRAG